MLRFQSTFPRGERRFLRGGSRLVSYFNPRSLVGNDGSFPGMHLCSRISIHVPSWGTTYTTGDPVKEENFNPRSLVGNDLLLSAYLLSFHISIHVPSWGTTSLASSNSSGSMISIHVPSWGTTANFHKYSLFFYAINIIFLLFIIPSLFSLVLFMLLF